MRVSEYQSKRDWRNIMQNRHGDSDNPLRKCVQCRYLIHTTEAACLCEQFTTPGGYKMPWNEKNGACGLFERVKEEMP
jgi:hypothetical protein